MAYIGNSHAGGLNYFKNVTSFAVFIYDLLGFTAYSLIGIIGLILFIIGIKSYLKRKNGSQNEETPQSNDEEIEETTSSVDGEIEETPVTNDDTPLNEETERERPKLFCGKQRFKRLKYYLSVIFTKKRILPIVLSVVLIISVICNIVQASRSDSLKRELDNAYNMQYYFEDLYGDARMKLLFYELFVVVVPDDGTNLYHKYGCEDCDIRISSIWIYTKKEAKSKGYVAHKKCCS
jgi:hypothetical protein